MRMVDHSLPVFYRRQLQDFRQHRDQTHSPMQVNKDQRATKVVTLEGMRHNFKTDRQIENTHRCPIGKLMGFRSAIWNVQLTSNSTT